MKYLIVITFLAALLIEAVKPYESKGIPLGGRRKHDEATTDTEDTDLDSIEEKQYTFELVEH